MFDQLLEHSPAFWWRPDNRK